MRKAGKAISKREDVKRDIRLIATTNVNWQNFLEPAPMAIILLGQLNLIATKQDFSLNHNPPKEGYKCIKYPDSFRATLCQVSNGGFWAFNEAHKNMDMIKLLSGNVLSHISTVIKYIVEGTSPQIECLLPVELEAIGEVADECVSLATSTEDKFAEVMELICEVLEATSKAKGLYENDYRSVKIAREVKEIHAKEAEQRKKDCQEELHEFKAKMLDAEAEYKKAVKSAPSGGKLFMMAVGDVFIKTASHIPQILGHFGGTTKSQGTAKNDKRQGRNSATSEVCDILEDISTFAEEVVILATDIRNNITDDERNEVEASKHHFEHAMKRINDLKPNPYNGDAAKVLKNLAHLAEHLIWKHSQKSMQKQDGGNSELSKLATDTRKQYKLLRVKLSSDNSHPGLMGTLPQSSKEQMTGSASLMQAVRQDYRFKVEMQMQRLKDAQKCYLDTSEKLEKQSKELAELVGTMAKLDLEKIQFEEICEILLEGMKVLSSVRHQWAKILKFFQGISNIVKSRMHHPLEHFVKSTKAVSSQLASPECDSSLKDILYMQAFTASAYASIIEQIAGMYCSVSDRFIMDDIAAMGKLIALDPDKDKGEIKMQLLELGEKSRKTQLSIKELVKETEEELVASIDRRLVQIDTEFSGVLPLPSPEEAKENKEIFASKNTEDAEQY